MKKKTDKPTKVIRIEYSEEERKKKIEIDEALRAKRDEGDSNSNVLISEVPKELKKEHAQHIIDSHQSSHARVTFRKLEEERILRHCGAFDRENPVEDERDETWGKDKEWGGWLNTPKLIAIAKKGIRKEKRERRKEFIKSFLYIASGLRFIDKLNTKRNRKKDEKAMIEDFFDNVALDEFKNNRTKPLSENLTDFLTHVISWKQWCWIFTISEKYELLHKFKNDYKDKEAIMEHSKLTKKLVKHFYSYFMKNR